MKECSDQTLLLLFNVDNIIGNLKFKRNIFINNQILY